MLRRAAPAAGSWLRRLRHRLSDELELFTFSMFAAASTSLATSGAVLHITQWSGHDVGSGGRLWGGSRRLVRYLEVHGDGRRPLDGLRLLELGAGTGGVGLAAGLLGAHATLTDQASFLYPGEELPTNVSQPSRTLLDLARENVARNEGAFGAAPPVVARLLWGDEEDERSLPHPEYDVICGGDILGFTAAHGDLLRTLRRQRGGALHTRGDATTALPQSRGSSAACEHPPCPPPRRVSLDSTVVLLECTDRGASTRRRCRPNLAPSPLNLF